MSEDNVRNGKSAGVNILAYHPRGTWANQVKVNGRTIRTAGRLNKSASSHTLLAIALTAALRSITVADAKKMGPQLISGKPRVFVMCSDPTFLDALRAKMERQDEPRLKAGRNFLMELARQLARFEITFKQDVPFLALQNWAVLNVPDPRVDYTFSPSVVSTQL